MGNLDKRLDRLESQEQPSYTTINVRYVETIVDPITGDRRDVEQPAAYDEAEPFTEYSPGKFIRVRYPQSVRSSCGE